MYLSLILLPQPSSLTDWDPTHITYDLYKVVLLSSQGVVPFLPWRTAFSCSTSGAKVTIAFVFWRAGPGACMASSRCPTVCCRLWKDLCQSPNSHTWPGMFGLRGPTESFHLGYVGHSAGYGATKRDLAEEVLAKQHRSR